MKSFTQKMLLVIATIMFSLNISAEKILFLTNRNDVVNQVDQTVIEALEDEGYDIIIKLSGSFDVSEIEDEEIDMIFLAEAIGSGDPQSLYAAELAGKIPIGIINCEPYAYNTSDRFHWCLGSRKGMTDYGRIFVTEEGAKHPVFTSIGVTEPSEGEEGSILLLSPVDEGAKAKMAYVGEEDVTIGTTLATDGTDENTKALIFAVEKGTDLGGGLVTTGRRMFMPIANAKQELTEEGKEVLLSCVKWVIEGNEYDPTGITEVRTGNVGYRNGCIYVSDTNAKIEIYDVTGKLYKSIEGQNAFDCSELKSGMYIARVKALNTRQSIKICVK